MKTKLLLFSLISVVALSSFILFKPSEKNSIHQISSPPVNGGWDKFYFGAMDMQYETSHSRFDSLGFSIWHRYINWDTLADGRHVPAGWMDSDSLFADPNTSTYIADVTDKLDEIYNNSPTNNRRKTLLVRPKITWLSYGQSSIYECEGVSHVNPDLWFYTFQSPNSAATDIQDNSQYGINQWVKYCQQNPNQTDGGAGWVVSRLKANTEQCQQYFNTAAWEGDTECDWFVKPRIRIDSAFAHNNPNADIVTIYIKNQYGRDTISPITIKAVNFRINSSTPYDGEYIDEFYFQENIASAIPFHGSLSTSSWAFGARGNSETDKDNENKADIQIYWHGNCDMWIDYVKVENDVADRLLRGNDPQFEQWLEAEGDLIGNHPSAFKFYLEYSAFNNLPCMKYVNEKLKYYTGGEVDLMQDMVNRIAEHVPYGDMLSVYNAGFLSRYYIDSVGFTQFFTETYPFFSCYYTGGQNISYYSKIPNTLPYKYGNNILAEDVSPSIYDTWLQHLLDTLNWMEGRTYNTCDSTVCGGGTYISKGLAFDQGNFRMQMKLGNEISKITGVPFIIMPQAHQWYLQGEVRREPTNEELDLMTNLAVSYGAKGIQYFWYHTYPGNSCDYGIGMLENNGILRLNNVYGQGHSSGQRYKKEVIWDISDRLSNKWGPYLMNFNIDTNSYIYRFTSEREEMATNTFISKLKTYTPVEFAPEDPNTPDFGSMPIDSNDNVYLQTAFFTKLNDPANEYNKYFMIVNRRCSPYLSIGSLDSIGGRRLIDMKINPDKLPNFSNWVIYNLENGDSVATFNKTNSNYIYLGDFMPGQGKLFRVSPVMQEGGTFVGNETCGNVNVKCKDNVYNGGYDLTIAANTTILFEEGKKIIINGGNFLCGGVRESWSEENIGNDVHLKGIAGTTHWDGIEITNCNTVSVGGTEFLDLRNDSLYALTVVNCNTLRVRYNRFESDQDFHTGAVSYNFIPMEEVPAIPLIEITGNKFYFYNSNLATVQIMNYGAGQTSALIRNNDFNGYSSALGLFTNNITGGSVKSNKFFNYLTGISMTATYTDFYKNYVQNYNESSNGLEINSGSVAHLNFNLGITYQNSGINTLINYESGSHNIETDNSYFTTATGYNIFDISNSHETHFYGILDDYYYGGKEDATHNCFKESGTEGNAYTDVIWYSNGSVTFDVNPYDCEIPTEDEFDTVVYAEDIVDTLWSFSSGLGGGYSNKQTKIRIISEPSLFEIKTDSLNYYLRKRRFNEVKRIGNELINNFSDSDRVVDIIQPLYFSSMLVDDTNHTQISALKTKLEDLISNNSENASLVLRCNYFIQKCKVILGEYSSAMSGFYDIMQNYPYSWEGIVASWDYSATQLISQSGSGGGENNSQNAERAELSLPNDDPKGEVKTMIDKTLNNIKETAIKQIKIEEQKIKELRDDKNNTKNIKQSKSLEKKFQQKKIMEEVIKPRNPQTVIEHMKFVNSDIQKIYSINNKSTGIDENNSIPEDYKLEQNYPNPFNPITKIKFELPKESKVTIVIYDILGRKVAQLINNELHVAGRYEVQFNGQNFASGVYFYRLVTTDFVDTKHMVLVK